MAEEIPREERTVVYTVPDMDKVVVKRNLVYRRDMGQELLLDAYLPHHAQPGDALPGVIFIHGGPVPADWAVKDRGQYRSWGPLAAASGFVAFTFNHRYHAPELLLQSVEDVVAAIVYVRENAAAFSLDPDRLCLWTCSGGGPHITFALREQPDYVCCLVIYYAVLDLRPVDFLVEALGEESCRQYSPLTAIEAGPMHFPIFIARAGLDHPGLNQTIDAFVTQALQVNATLELMNHPQGEHGFDVMNDDARSRHILARTLAFMKESCTTTPRHQ